MKTPLIIVTAPSGAGKSSLCERALGEINLLVDSVSYTTRPARTSESEGKPYHFVSEEKFKELIKNNFFIEWANVHGNLYGTPRYQLEDAWKAGLYLIMDVDIKGAASLKALYPHSQSIFILPPSLEELRNRILLRDSGKTPNLEVRMRNAAVEIAEASRFDHRVINAHFETAYSQFKKIIEEILKAT